MAELKKAIKGTKNSRKQQKQQIKSIKYPKWGNEREMIGHIDQAIESMTLEDGDKTILKSLFEDFGQCIQKNEQVCMYMVDELK